MLSQPFEIKLKGNKVNHNSFLSCLNTSGANIQPRPDSFTSLTSSIYVAIYPGAYNTAKLDKYTTNTQELLAFFQLW